jgi:hypothetical protein
MVAMMVR